MACGDTPNEGERKVCIFPDCKQLTPQDQNVLLKIVEEGPAYAAFIFCTPTAHMLLPTIRSRCVEMHVTGEEQEVSSRAAALCRVLTEGDDAVLQHLVSLEPTILLPSFIVTGSPASDTDTQRESKIAANTLFIYLLFFFSFSECKITAATKEIQSLQIVKRATLFNKMFQKMATSHRF